MLDYNSYNNTILESVYMNMVDEKVDLNVDESGVDANSFTKIERDTETLDDEDDRYSFLKNKQKEIALQVTQKLPLEEIAFALEREEEFVEETILLYDECEKSYSNESIYNVPIYMGPQEIDERKCLVILEIKDNKDIHKKIYSVLTQTHKNTVLLVAINKDCDCETEEIIRNIRKVIVKNMIIHKAKSNNSLNEVFSLLNDSNYEYDYLLVTDSYIKSNEVYNSIKELYKSNYGVIIKNYNIYSKSAIDSILDKDLLFSQHLESTLKNKGYKIKKENLLEKLKRKFLN